MKKLYIVLISLFLSLSLAAACHAQDITLQVNHITYTSSSVDDDSLIKLRIGYKNFDLWGSAEKPRLRFGKQQCVDTTIIGMGVGFKKEIFHNINLTIDMGYFDPHYKTCEAFHMDGALYAFSNDLGISLGDPYYRFWNNYSYDTDGNIGGAIGLESEYNISSNFSVGLNIEYRYLNLPYKLLGWDGIFNPEDPHWELVGYQDYSSIQGGIFFRYKF
jgi:hypothetical protein